MSQASTVLPQIRPKMTVNPSFVLPGIDPWAIRDQYHQSAFAALTLPLGRKANLPLVNSAIQAPVGTTPMDDCFSIRLKNNAIQTIVTTNTCFFNLLTKDAQVVPIGGVCHWCRFSYETHSITIPTPKQQFILEGPQAMYIELPLEHWGYNVYFGEGLYCSPQCAKAMLLSILGTTNMQRTHYQHSEYYLDEIYTMMQLAKPEITEIRPLRPAPDYRLSKAMGGPLDKEEFHRNTCIYIPIAGVVLAPIKFEFIRTAPGALYP
jgi:hypothetical protein